MGILLPGCKSKAILPPMPDMGIQEEEINSRILLEAPEGWNTLKSGDIIGLTVSVISDDQIAYKEDEIIILLLKEGEWVEIPNQMKYPPGINILSQTNNPFEIGATGVAPILPVVDEKFTLRIVLIGYIYRGGQLTNDRTAAYIDVELSP
jgi:hypothetical protein